MRYRLPRFRGEGQLTVPSDVINRPKSTDINTKRSLILVLSVARTNLMKVQNFIIDYLYFWSNKQILYFPLCRERRRLSRELKYAFSYDVAVCSYIHWHCILFPHKLNFNMLHCLWRVAILIDSLISLILCISFN